MKTLKEWFAFLEPEGPTDTILRALAILGLSMWLYFNGMVFQEPYSLQLIELHLYPWWNILLVAMVAAGALWCPRVGVLAGLAVLLYLSDMDLLMRPEEPDIEAAMLEHFYDMVKE